MAILVPDPENLLQYDLVVLRFQSVAIFVPNPENLLQYNLVVLRFQSAAIFVPNPKNLLQCDLVVFRSSKCGQFSTKTLLLSRPSTFCSYIILSTIETL